MELAGLISTKTTTLGNNGACMQCDPANNVSGIYIYISNGCLFTTKNESGIFRFVRGGEINDDGRG